MFLFVPVLDFWDYLLVPFYILVFIGIAVIIKNKHRNDSRYDYLVLGLSAKFVGAIALGLIYNYHYEGGDTTNYFESAVALVNLFFENPACSLRNILNPTVEDYFCFSGVTGYPIYSFWDKHAFFVVRLITPIVLLGFKSFFASSIIVAAICYTGIWKLFLVFTKEFPQLYKELAIAILFIPSVVFWGSGILKDTITLAAIGWYTYAFYNLLIKKQSMLSNGLALLISCFLIVAIKPYILFALLPGSLIWLSNEQSKRVKSKWLKRIFLPFLLLIGCGLGYFALKQMDSKLGVYSIDTVFDRAVVVQSDLKQDYYQGNSFDIGEFDGSPISMVQKAPFALFAAFFRPTLLDVRNPVMLFSAIENTYLMLLTLFLLLKLKFWNFFTLIGQHPLVLFSFLFSLFFAFSVGITISNFGALVRLKIPAIPFFVASLFIIKYFYEQKKLNSTL